MQKTGYLHRVLLYACVIALILGVTALSIESRARFDADLSLLAKHFKVDGGFEAPAALPPLQPAAIGPVRIEVQEPVPAADSPRRYATFRSRSHFLRAPPVNTLG